MAGKSTNLVLGWISWVAYSVVFIAALLPRVLNLGTMLTTDERLWLDRSTTFISALASLNLAETLQTAHPGVTTMWLSGVFLSAFYHPEMAFSTKLMIAALPIAMTIALGIVIMYYLLGRLFGTKIALLAALLIALDPFYIAYSRVVHLDGLLTTFMTLAVLAFLAALKNREDKKLLLAAGAFSGLAFLTKLPSAFLVPYLALLLILWYGLSRDKVTVEIIRSHLIPALKIAGVLAIVSVCTFVALWPSMWVQPVRAVSTMVDGAGFVLENPHGSGYFMGQVSDGSFGCLFYPVVILMKLTPVTLLFSILGVFTAVVTTVRKKRLSDESLLVLFILLFVILFAVQMTLGEKKGERYLLPAFPFFDTLAAVGIYKGFELVASCSRKLMSLSGSREVVFGAVIGALLIVQVALLMPVHPYYLSYFNPVAFGGPAQADKMIGIGWGEGMDKAAAYLNDVPGAQNLTVAAQYPGFEQYFEGKTVGMSEARESDYIVFYIGPVQRHWDYGLWQEYKNQTPVKIIVVNSIDYCWIYKTVAG